MLGDTSIITSLSDNSRVTIMSTDERAKISNLYQLLTTWLEKEQITWLSLLCGHYV